MIVISNASPLIALSRIDLLHLLKDLFADVYIPDAVYQETVTNCDIILQRTRISQATHEFIKVVVPTVRPPDHSLYERVTAEAIRYWTKWFGQTRNLTPKGRVWATTGGLP